MNDKSILLDAPIPGANYTSNTKNYPWHRPPDITNFDEAIEVSVAKLTDKEATFGILSMMANGMTLAQATDIFVTSGIAKGKWTPDFAILLAGPVARIIKMLADGYGIEYRTGIEENPSTLPSPVGLKKMMEIDEKKAEKVGAEVASKVEDIQEEAEDTVESPSTGLMGISMADTLANEAPASEEEQSSMLGYGEDEDDLEPMQDDEEVLA